MYYKSNGGVQININSDDKSCLPTGERVGGAIFLGIGDQDSMTQLVFNIVLKHMVVLREIANLACRFYGSREKTHWPLNQWPKNLMFPKRNSFTGYEIQSLRPTRPERSPTKIDETTPLEFAKRHNPAGHLATIST